MRKIVLTEWVSLDGYSSGPENDMSFVGESFNAEMGAYEDAILDTADTLLLGRVTYESFAGSWPHVPDSETASEEEKRYARKLNAMRKVVFSRTLAAAELERFDAGAVDLSGRGSGTQGVGTLG